MKIEGVPEGWELVAVRPALEGEWYIDTSGRPLQVTDIPDWGKQICVPIIRRVEPVCTWQHGVFADGWIAQDNQGEVYWHDEKPTPATIGFWESGDDETIGLDVFSRLYINPPVFRSDLPWTSRIQQVGPTIEVTLKEAT